MQFVMDFLAFMDAYDKAMSTTCLLPAERETIVRVAAHTYLARFQNEGLAAIVRRLSEAPDSRAVGLDGGRKPAEKGAARRPENRRGAKKVTKA